MDYAPSISSNLSQHDSTMAGISSSSHADLPVKYTPVTGRISRAKKGVPVHTCDICRPVKVYTLLAASAIMAVYELTELTQIRHLQEQSI
jgi:hypothetical protein